MLQYQIVASERNRMHILRSVYSGLNTPYLYFSVWTTEGQRHREDLSLHSINAHVRLLLLIQTSHERRNCALAFIYVNVCDGLLGARFRRIFFPDPTPC